MSDKNFTISANNGAVAIVAIITTGLVGCFLGSRKTALEKFKYKRAADDRVKEIQEEIIHRQVELRGKEIARENVNKEE